MMFGKARSPVSPCLHWNAEGTAFMEFSCLYPQIGRYYFEYVSLLSVATFLAHKALTLALWLQLGEEL